MDEDRIGNGNGNKRAKANEPGIGGSGDMNNEGMDNIGIGQLGDTAIVSVALTAPTPGTPGMFKGLECYISVMLLLYSISNGALGSPDLLQSYSVITIFIAHNHHSNNNTSIKFQPLNQSINQNHQVLQAPLCQISNTCL